MGLLRALPLLLIAQHALAITNMVMHESVAKVPSGFKASGSPSPSQELKLLVALVQSNITGLAKVVDAVSIPSGPSYGKYLTAAEIAEYVKPPADSLSSVMDWVTPNVASVKPFTPAGDVLQLSLSVEQAESLFNAKFNTYTNPNGQQIFRALNYSLPSSLLQHILHVHPIVAFTPPPQATGKNTMYKRSPMSLKKRQLAPCEDIAEPACLLATDFYGLPNRTISGSTTNKIGVQGFNTIGGDGASEPFGEYANSADLQTFLKMFRPDLAGTTFSLETLNGAVNLQDNSGGLEGAIDIQYTVGVAGDVPVTYLLDNGDDAATEYMDTINFLLAQDEPPTVFSTSYANEEVQLTQAVSTTVCNGYMQLAALGISMLFASGDGGAADNVVGCTTLIPMFPSTCPYVTSVGGTFFQPPTAFISSAGGFSNYFPVPSYQAADTAAYLKSIGTTNQGFYNPSGRVSPMSRRSGRCSSLLVTSAGGTSCATPIFASFIALVNDRLIAAGKPVLGFLNPLLYSTGRGGLDDVTVGESSGCASHSGGGWNATTGWDPISGLGTPDFPAMLRALGI
ncbi:subtilisin-like protein [Roridomyces roridus]|uniref:Subtilisin-like protein n=1 Tax=Roridomyces roridus TaxID=1738132 RepID=A0AAD7C138_9AGAR|nr:subtilisin-like protein [Roridomyces roridus]